MPKITLDRPWTYRTPEKTIDYPAGEHEVFKYIAEQAVEDGAIEGYQDGDTDKPSEAGAKGPARKSKG